MADKPSAEQITKLTKITLRDLLVNADISCIRNEERLLAASQVDFDQFMAVLAETVQDCPDCLMQAHGIICLFFIDLISESAPPGITVLAEAVEGNVGAIVERWVTFSLTFMIACRSCLERIQRREGKAGHHQHSQ